MAAPTLLVGLGGTGSKIVQRVYALSTPAQRKNLSFVVFDTDINELREISERTPQIKVVQTSAKLSVGQYLQADHYSRDNWFPVNKIMNRKAMTEGAGQVRSISRLAFNTTIQQGRMAPLDEAISELYTMNGDKGAQALRVMLVGSLCGGTGSGLLLPVSLYIRNYLKTKMQQGSAVIRGFFILPEVFFHVAHTTAEQNNLMCNAYAAVREIDAFMMKGDGSLPESYDLHYMVPRPGSSIQDDLADSPMDFCFLYDAKNIDGKELTSFDAYNEHAANCIYAQSIAPTSKRSNSSEDNIIGEVLQAGGRNRFCGAGSALLEYPMEDVERYLTLVWARDSISSEWLDIDREYKKKQKAYQQRKRLGQNVAPVIRNEHYIESVKEGYVQRKPFLATVRNMCYQFNETGFMELHPYWLAYLGELDKFIMSSIERMRGEVKNIEMICDVYQESARSTKSGSKRRDGRCLKDTYEGWYPALLQYMKASRKYAETLGENLAYTLFKDDADYSNTDNPFRVEYWLMQGGQDTFIHPNAVRFFLSNVLEILEKERKKLRGSAVKNREGDEDGGKGDTKDGIEKFWVEFEEKTFNDPQKPDEKGTLDDFCARHYMDKNASWLKKVTHKKQIKVGKQALDNGMSKYYAKTKLYWEVCVKCAVYDAAVRYLTEMLKGFDSFYDVLEKKVSGLGKDIQELEEKYRIPVADEKDGITVRYVCADADCLKQISEDVVNLGSSLDLPAELCKGIYNKVRKFAMAEEKPNSERYFSETYESSILGYYRKSILDGYESTVCMDVLSALRYEARVKNRDEELTSDDMDRYSARVIESTQIRAMPFIESPIGREPRIISACTYSVKLADADETGRRSFIKKHLGDNGGVPDQFIDPNRIVFYKAVYGLRANELGKFAPPRDSETDTSNGGNYFHAYYERIGRIHPEPRRSREVNPHVDRWWYAITKMPDLDEAYQEKQINDINAAFFWSLLTGAVTYSQADKGSFVYKIKVDDFNMTSEDEDLIVSNGTPCDNLYEVLDALTIFPLIVREILKKRDGRIVEDEKKEIDDTFLFEKLKKFHIDEFTSKKTVVIDGGEEEEAKIVRSILEIPLLMKKSVPASYYYEEAMVKLLKTELDEVKRYLHCFINDEAVFQTKYEEILLQQYDLLLENAEEDALHEGIYRDSLFVRILNLVAGEFETVYKIDKAEEIREFLRVNAIDSLDSNEPEAEASVPTADDGAGVVDAVAVPVAENAVGASVVNAETSEQEVSAEADNQEESADENA